MKHIINRDNTCCFSGYRPEKLPWGIDESDKRCETLKENLFTVSNKVINNGYSHFICGMARGSDTYFCETILALRDIYNGISIEAAIPYEKQAEKWLPEERERYSILVGKCDIVTFVSKEYSGYCMLKRNRYMVNNSSLLLAVYDGKLGGTANTVKYAVHKGLDVIEIIP